MGTLTGRRVSFSLSRPTRFRLTFAIQERWFRDRNRDLSP